MRLTTLLFGSLAGFAIAAKLPDCAGSCISQAVKTTGCSSRDSQCICSHDSFESSVKQCTVTNCGEGKASGAAAFVADFCKSVNDLKKRHGRWQGNQKQSKHSKNNSQYHQQRDTQYKQKDFKGKVVTPPKYGKPSAPVYAYVASMTVWDSAPSATIYAPGQSPAAKPSSNPYNSGSGQGGWAKANGDRPAYAPPAAPAAPSPTIYAPGHYPAAVPSSNPWNVGSGHGGWPKANPGEQPAHPPAAPSAAPSYRPSYAPSYRPSYAPSMASAAPSAAPSGYWAKSTYGKAKGTYGRGRR
ncbi:uncharacterized protein CLAFUR5_05417 [Fulvia fulva]|uniref:CFEM domain-containing protein n=1 Tax=Passalora fulva TaxID=5499 RepID=A0A9Q8LI15_PASFU|nr:uncharacterized protein CLAFUR5_05417 [Fulvia fulva]KAK4625459.1 hypothetical protein CLAFUR0_05271 [Fulvia fulva]UJO17755.1 hypothetical protein CLAFUR5_05417 [Fulvia fulva]